MSTVYYIEQELKNIKYRKISGMNAWRHVLRWPGSPFKSSPQKFLPSPSVGIRKWSQGTMWPHHAASSRKKIAWGKPRGAESAAGSQDLSYLSMSGWPAQTSYDPSSSH